MNPAKPPVKPLPLNFLLGCGQHDLDNFELARLAEVANQRKELHAVLDRVIDAMTQAALAAWFKAQDRQALKHAIENEESPMEWARRMVKERQRTAEELLPRAALEPGVAHRAAAIRYQERNVAEGKCMKCPQPLDRNSVCYCSKHMAAERDRYHRKKGLADPGSRECLYAGEAVTERRGRHPNNLAALAIAREQRTRALLAERGLPAGSAAVSLKAVTEALLSVMPKTSADAMTQDELFQKAGVVTKITGQKALAKLLADGKIERTGEGWKGHRFRYFLNGDE
jgi:hypothetical protein